MVLKLKEKEKRLLLAAVLAVVLLVIAVLGVVIYQYTHFDLYGMKTDIFADEIDFDGREISDFDELRAYLKRFTNLQRVSLGSYPVEAERSDAFRQEFSGTELLYRTVVKIEGEDVSTDAETLDLSDHGYTDLKTLLEKMSYMPKLKTVLFGEQTIPQTQKEQLEKAYPDVSFEVIGSYEIYGKRVLENAEKLDLRDVQIDESLIDQLTLLPQLRSVDLHGQQMTQEQRIALAQQFPDVSFGWTIFYDGEEYDSSITELDISGKPVNSLDELRRAIKELPDLQKVIMCDCGMSNEDLAEFRDEMDPVKIVWRVRLGTKWSLRTDAVAFSVLIVHYDYPRMRTNDIQILKYCTDLRALDLGHQALTDISVLGDCLPELRLLILADNSITDISPIAKMTHLHYLELFVNRIRDLSPLRECKELVDVNISYNPISDIEPLLYSPMMERVWLESTYVGGNGFAQLAETYPNAKIVRYGSGSVDQGWRWGSKHYEQMMDMWFNNYYGDEFSKYDDPEYQKPFFEKETDDTDTEESEETEESETEIP